MNKLSFKKISMDELFCWTKEGRVICIKNKEKKYRHSEEFQETGECKKDAIKARRIYNDINAYIPHRKKARNYLFTVGYTDPYELAEELGLKDPEHIKVINILYDKVILIERAFDKINRLYTGKKPKLVLGLRCFTDIKNIVYLFEPAKYDFTNPFNCDMNGVNKPIKTLYFKELIIDDDYVSHKYGQSLEILWLPKKWMDYNGERIQKIKDRISGDFCRCSKGNKKCKKPVKKYKNLDEFKNAHTSTMRDFRWGGV